MAEQNAAQQENTNDVVVQSKGQKPTLFILLAVINMVIVLATGVMFYLGKQKEANQISIDHIVTGEHQTRQKEAREAEENYIGKVVPLETFLVNLSGSQGRKIAKVNMEFEVKGDLVEQEIDKRRVQIRDIIIILLSSKTYEEVSTREGKERLRNEIIDTVNTFLTKGKLTKVYFTEFIYN